MKRTQHPTDNTPASKKRKIEKTYMPCFLPDTAMELLCYFLPSNDLLHLILTCKSIHQFEKNFAPRSELYQMRKMIHFVETSAEFDTITEHKYFYVLDALHGMLEAKAMPVKNYVCIFKKCWSLEGRWFYKYLFRYASKENDQEYFDVLRVMNHEGRSCYDFATLLTPFQQVADLFKIEANEDIELYRKHVEPKNGVNNSYYSKYAQSVCQYLGVPITDFVPARVTFSDKDTSNFEDGKRESNDTINLLWNFVIDNFLSLQVVNKLRDFYARVKIQEFEMRATTAMYIDTHILVARITRKNCDTELLVKQEETNGKRETFIELHIDDDSLEEQDWELYVGDISRRIGTWKEEIDEDDADNANGIAEFVKQLFPQTQIMTVEEILNCLLEECNKAAIWQYPCENQIFTE